MKAHWTTVLGRPWSFNRVYRGLHLRFPQIKGRLGGRRIQAVLIALGWGTMNAAAALNGIFQGFIVPASAGGTALVLAIADSTASSPLSHLTEQIEQPLTITFLGDPIGKWIFFLEILGIAVFAAFLIEDPTRALFSFFVSYAIGGVLVYFVLSLPGVIGNFPVPEALVGLGIVFSFDAFFPVPLLLGLLGTFVGVGLAEGFS